MKLRIDYIKTDHPKRVSVMAGGEWYSTWKNDISMSWKKGDIIDYPIKENEYNGKFYKNIILPKEKKDSANVVNDEWLNKIFTALQEIKELIKESKGPESEVGSGVKTTEPSYPNIPFDDDEYLNNLIK